MPGFDAGSIVEPLDYNFTKFGGKRGVIPEPDDKRIAKLYADQESLTKEIVGEHVKLPVNPGPQDIAEALMQSTMSETYLPMLDGMTHVYAEFCQSSPSEDELRMLPPRIRTLFFQWIIKNIRPELDAADSKTVLRPLRIAPGGSPTT